MPTTETLPRPQIPDMRDLLDLSRNPDDIIAQLIQEISGPAVDTRPQTPAFQHDKTTQTLEAVMATRALTRTADVPAAARKKHRPAEPPTPVKRPNVDRQKTTRPGLRQKLGRGALKLATGATAAIILLGHLGSNEDSQNAAPPLETPVAASIQTSPAQAESAGVETVATETRERAVTIFDLIAEPLPEKPNNHLEGSATSSEQKPNKYRQLAPEFAAELARFIRKDGKGNLQLFKTDNKQASSWVASTMLHGISPYADLAPGTPGALPPQDVANILTQYFDYNPNTAGYATYPTVRGKAGTERFIDDGMWNAQLRLWQYAKQVKSGQVPDQSALTEAQGMINLAMHNYNPHKQLVRWLTKDSSDNDEYNTISTATTAETILMLDQFLADPVLRKKNMNFAIQLYDGLRQTMYNSSNHLYYDGMHLSGELNRTELPYNTGVMVSVGMLLYEATGNPRYIEEVEKTAASSLKVWDPNGIRMHDPSLVAIYYDRLANLAQVTKSDTLRTSIYNRIIGYADWYTSLKNIEQLNMPQSVWVKEKLRGVFAGTKLHIATLAARAQDAKTTHKGPLKGTGNYLTPEKTPVYAQSSNAFERSRDKGIA